MSRQVVGNVAAYKILLIEDDQFKQEQVEQTVRDAVPDVCFVVCRSVQQAVAQVRADIYDLIVLDISLPSHESRPGGAQPLSQPSGGVEVLLELSYEQRGDKVVILTQYPDIEYDGRLYPLSKFQKAIAGSISVNIADVLLFNPKDRAWRDQLGKVLV
jgi:CheY-like chemotaxis protein